MNQSKTFKLIVQVSDTCLELLRYLNKNIVDVNKLGARVQVEKISKTEFDEEMVNTLRKKGIARLPALIAPDGQVFIGLQRIRGLFEKNLNSARNNERTNPAGDYCGPEANAELGTNPDLTDFWQQELYAGFDKKGKLIPRKDKDEGEDEGGDIEKRLADYQRNVPKHRRTGGGRERDIDLPPRERPRGRTRRDEEPEDNIESSDDEEQEPQPPPRRGGKSGGRMPRMGSSGDAAGDDMDQRMLAAWMDKNPQEQD